LNNDAFWWFTFNCCRLGACSAARLVRPRERQRL
jgi:hypothetical protein